MNKIKKPLALLLALILGVSMAGCSIGGNDKYRVVEELTDQQFCVGFRLDDKVGKYITAAMAVLQDSGAITKLSQKWFGTDASLLQGDGEALSKLLEIPNRTLIVGYDDGRMPFSGKGSGGQPDGFDVELAKAVCKELGWKIRFIAIDVSQAEVELNSGNVDCVWGGYAYDKAAKKITQSPVYMENTIIIASLAGSKIRSKGSLSNKTLTLSENSYYSLMLEENPALEAKLSMVNRVPGGTEACFAALDEGSCDAIITDRAAIDYYR